MNNPGEPDAANHLAATAAMPPLTTSAVSWSAILSGAAGAAALSLILLILGAGLGLSCVSPWVGSGITATTFGVSTILWVTLTQIVAAGMGGYLAGRLRVRWVGVHTDEVHFRDTAHGFLAWAVASLATATLLTSVIGSIVSGGIQAGTAVPGERSAATAGGATQAVPGSEVAKPDSDRGTLSYFVDSLFRSDSGEAMAAAARTAGGTLSGGITQPASAASRSEVAGIFKHAMRTEILPMQDARYVGQVVARHTRLTQEDAEKRVTDTYSLMQAGRQKAEAMARTAADAARKATANASLWLFVSLLSGAFVASLTATFGGRQRDR